MFWVRGRIWAQPNTSDDFLGTTQSWDNVVKDISQEDIHDLRSFDKWFEYHLLSDIHFEYHLLSDILNKWFEYHLFCGHLISDIQILIKTSDLDDRVAKGIDF